MKPHLNTSTNAFQHKEQQQDTKKFAYKAGILK